MRRDIIFLCQCTLEMSIYIRNNQYIGPKSIIFEVISVLTGSAVITHDVTTGTGYCLVGFNWIIDFLN